MSSRRSTRPAVERVLVDGRPVEVRRSPRRRRSVQARREGELLVLLVPDSLSEHEEQQWARRLGGRIERRGERRQREQEPDELARRAVALATRHLDGPAGRPVRAREVRWVGNQGRRWGSCSTDTAVIRLSDRLRPMPDWVLDYVLLHELAHLVEHHHNQRFHALVDAYPMAERAKGYLAGWVAGSAVATSPDGEQPAPGGDGLPD